MRCPVRLIQSASMTEPIVEDMLDAAVSTEHNSRWWDTPTPFRGRAQLGFGEPLHGVQGTTRADGPPLQA